MQAEIRPFSAPGVVFTIIFEIPGSVLESSFISVVTRGPAFICRSNDYLAYLFDHMDNSMAFLSWLFLYTADRFEKDIFKNYAVIPLSPVLP